MEEILTQIATAFFYLLVLILVGTVIRHTLPGIRDIFVPVSLISGFIGLLIGPQVLGRALAWTGQEQLSGGLISSSVLEVWEVLPGLFITVIFACLFLGKPVPGLRKMWHQAGPQILLGHTLSWGQYVIGIALTLFLLTPVWGLHPSTGALLEISFVGGHGTVAGMRESFAELGFEEGTDLGLGLATVGVVAGALIGTVLVNWAARRKIIKIDSKEDSESASSAGSKDSGSKWPRTLSVHLALIGIAIAVGWVLQQALIWTEDQLWGHRIELFQYMPLFPLAMIGALLVQIGLDRFGLGEIVHRGLINRISAVSLDILITAALATLSLAVIGEFFVPFMILAAAAILWNVGGFLFLAPRMIPRHWFERGSGDFGQSIGMAALGLLLIQLADPHNRSHAKERFGYKQVLFEPLVGGGLFTAASAPLIFQAGPGWVLAGTFLVTTAFMAAGFWLCRYEQANHLD
ncbi:MAG: sodium:glutamate symporter [Chromatiales bacterium]|nr:sodium:glutamate symporter [Chromatiales bacterium]